MKPRYTDAFWGEHPFDGDMILIKNKNKNLHACLIGTGTSPTDSATWAPNSSYL